MKIIIDIPDLTYESIMKSKVLKDVGADFIRNGKPFPDNATNGDVIKALFPNAEFDNAMPFTDNRWETMNLDTENKTRAMYKPTQLRTYADWWNAPYKTESEEI